MTPSVSQSSPVPSQPDAPSDLREARVRMRAGGGADGFAGAEAAVEALPGVASVKASPERGEMILRYSPAFEPAALQARLAALGAPLEMQRIELEVEGMSCASCTGRVERIARARPGILAARANLATRRLSAEAWAVSDPQDLAQAITALGFAASPLAEAEEPQPASGAMADEERALWRDSLLALALVLPVFITEMGAHLIPGLSHWLSAHTDMRMLWPLQALLTALVLALPGRRFFRKGLSALWRRAPDMNSLVALGTGAAFLWSGLVLIAPELLPEASRVVYFESAGVIILLILIGRAMEARARGRAGAAIRALMGLQPATARLEDGRDLPLSEVVAGMRLMLRAGERVPVDGVVVSGRSAIDESMLTGEPMPVLKEAGAKVAAGTLNGTGAMVILAEAVGRATTLARITRLVEEAQGSKLPVQDLVDRITAWFVPAVLALSALTLLIWYLASGDLARALSAAMAVLIIACPCAMGLATPVSVLVGSTRAARLGILFRRGAALQHLATARRIAFDKTGTLTEGRPHLARIIGPQELLPLAAAVERGSEHPLAAALLAAAPDAPEAERFTARPGFGAEAYVRGEKISVGAARMFDGIPAALQASADEAAAAGESLIFVARNDQVEGLITVTDPLRDSAAKAIARLHEMGLHSALISGDTALAAGQIVARLGIEEVHAGILPEGKQQIIAARGGAFVGDGINDAPALARADIGIAMGAGSDVAIEAGDVVLMRSDPLAVATAVQISRAVMRNIRQNLFWAFAYNIALIPVAAGVLVPFGGPGLSPVLAAGAMAASSVLVLSNALRLRFVKAVV